ncbi:hypothetical protein [Massilia sp. YIM B02443]|uniref:hypothetical protein n=1 Tax=Massilia sp. YIM B02443 TaxID=3050127 RepID=UPI0025B71BE0|nr:hypothetical protein [Massilia sp. YIM B02443]MDN4039740.1 hypothetical protein [Massilia sp. YIM B02443]
MSPTTLKIRLFLNGQKFQERTAAAPKPCRKGIAGSSRDVHGGHGKNHLAPPGNTLLPGSGDPADAALHDTASYRPAAFFSDVRGRTIKMAIDYI